MTRETKDGFVIHDKRFWVEDEERDRDETAVPAAPPAAPAGPDPEVLRAALADLEEAKRRVSRDAEKQLERQRAQVLEALLPVLDNLARSIEAASATGSPSALLDGVKLVQQQFLSALAGFGLERRTSVGERFDPRVHDAIAVVPVAEPSKDGLIVAELEPAYFVGERVIRPAKVSVGRAAERPAS